MRSKELEGRMRDTGGEEGRRGSKGVGSRHRQSERDRQTGRTARVTAVTAEPQAALTLAGSHCTDLLSPTPVSSLKKKRGEQGDWRTIDRH